MTLSKILAVTAVVGFAFSVNAQTSTQPTVDSSTKGVNSAVEGVSQLPASLGQSTLDEAAKMRGAEKRTLRSGFAGTSDVVNGTSDFSVGSWERVVAAVKGAKVELGLDGSTKQTHNLAQGTSNAAVSVWNYLKGVVKRAGVEAEVSASHSTQASENVGNAALGKRNKSGLSYTGNLSEESRVSVVGVSGQSGMSLSNLAKAISGNPAYLNGERREEYIAAYNHANDMLAARSNKAEDAVVTLIDVAYKVFGVEKDAHFEDVVLATLL